MTDQSSPAELRARATKASRIVLALERYATRRPSADRVRGMDDAGREAACMLACQRPDCARRKVCVRPPSEQTWAMVTGLMAARQEPE